MDQHPPYISINTINNIMEAHNTALGLMDKGESPSEAFAKAAKMHNLTPDQARLLVWGSNSALTLDSLDRPSKSAQPVLTPLIDADSVIAKLELQNKRATVNIAPDPMYLLPPPDAAQLKRAEYLQQLDEALNVRNESDPAHTAAWADAKVKKALRYYNSKSEILQRDLGILRQKLRDKLDYLCKHAFRLSGASVNTVLGHLKIANPKGYIVIIKCKERISEPESECDITYNPNKEPYSTILAIIDLLDAINNTQQMLDVILGLKQDLCERAGLTPEDAAKLLYDMSEPRPDIHGFHSLPPIPSDIVPVITGDVLDSILTGQEEEADADPFFQILSKIV